MSGLAGHWNPVSQRSRCQQQRLSVYGGDLVGLATLDDLNKANAKLDIRDQSRNMWTGWKDPSGT
ncbi:MAG: hypothetical protein ACLR5S_09890 [Ruminococcus sp.]